MADDAKPQKVKRERRVREPKVRPRKNGPKLAEPVRYSARPATESLMLYDLGECLTRILHYTSDTASRSIVRLYMTGDRRMHAALLAFNAHMTFSTCKEKKKCKTSTCQCIRLGDYAKGTSRLRTIVARTATQLHVDFFHSGAMRWKKDYLQSLPASLTALSLGDGRNIIRLCVEDVQHLKSAPNLTFLRCPLYYDKAKLPLTADFSHLTKLRVLRVMENFRYGNGKIGKDVGYQEVALPLVLPPTLEVLACKQGITALSAAAYPTTLTAVKCGTWSMTRDESSRLFPNLVQLCVVQVTDENLPDSVRVLRAGENFRRYVGLPTLDGPNCTSTVATVYDYQDPFGRIVAGHGEVHLNDPTLVHPGKFIPANVLNNPCARNISVLCITYSGVGKDLMTCIKAMPNLVSLRLVFLLESSYPEFIPSNSSVKYLSISHEGRYAKLPPLVAAKPEDVSGLVKLSVYCFNHPMTYTLLGFEKHRHNLCIDFSTIVFIGKTPSRGGLPNCVMDGVAFTCLDNDRTSFAFNTWIVSNGTNGDGRYFQELADGRDLTTDVSSQPRPWKLDA